MAAASGKDPPDPTPVIPASGPPGVGVISHVGHGGNVMDGDPEDGVLPSLQASLSVVGRQTVHSVMLLGQVSGELVGSLEGTTLHQKQGHGLPGTLHHAWHMQPTQPALTSKVPLPCLLPRNTAVFKPHGDFFLDSDLWGVFGYLKNMNLKTVQNHEDQALENKS